MVRTRVLPLFCKGSCALAFAVLILSFAVTTADARRRGHHYDYSSSRQSAPPVDPRTQSYARGSFDDRKFDHRNVHAGPQDGAFDPKAADRHGTNRDELLALVPSNWSEQPPDPNWGGHRFVSPEGDASIEFYRRSTKADTRDQHLKSVAFVDGEELTYLRRERDWLVVSGFKGEDGDRIFFRKVALACNGRYWGHVAVEYPADDKRAFDRVVTNVSKAVDAAVNASCEDATVGRGWRDPH